MKLLKLFQCFLVLGLMSTTGAQKSDTGIDRYLGSWNGEGRFYNVKLSAEVGKLSFQLEIKPDFSITGQVGNATLRDAKLSVDEHNGGYMIKGQLEGKIFTGSDFHKKNVIFLMHIPEGDEINGDFHLKSNFIFDFSMRPGEFTLIRKP
ncbi:hypothetical protein HQ531_00040 [bacterium]|nr:hypothetical protein [bacterium]